MKKTVFISGGASGIGAAITSSFARSGHQVVIGHNSNKDRASSLAAKLREKGFEVACEEIDFRTPHNVGASWDSIVSHYGPPDVVVNNAAIAQEKNYLTITESDFAQMMTVNSYGPFRLAQLALPNMFLRGWGRIINIASIGGQTGGINQMHYAASKAALISLTRSLARVSASHGVTVNAVAPGLVETPMSAEELNTEAGRDKVAGLPIGRTGTPEEIADVVLFLASEESSYIVGQTLNLNGGSFFG